MQMDNSPPLMLHLKSKGEGGNLIDAAPIVPDGTDSPSGRVVIGVHLGASKPSIALTQLSFDALKLCGAAAELLQLSCGQKPAIMTQAKISSCIPG